MPKSKYPNQIDTSIELRYIRDNLTEMTSDVINSVTSAIFAIEKTLGTNPQGASGNSVASRLNNALDENGNILKTALDRANVLSGPITDADVSKVAGIQESKLKLQYPTTLLQEQVSSLNRQLEEIILTLDELSSEFSAHINSNAINRHVASAVSVDTASVNSGDIATTSLVSGTVQTAFESLYNDHINYTGSGISSSNNSHRASQIHYDNENNSSLIPSSSVQGAIDDLANVGAVGLKNSILNLNSNGRIRTGSVSDQFAGNSLSEEIMPLTGVSYSDVSGSSRTTFVLDSAVTPSRTVKRFDILTISGSTNENDNKSYLIDTTTLSSGAIQSITVFGSPQDNSTDGISAKVTANPFVVYNGNGLNACVRPRANRTNEPDVHIANPNAATIISDGIEPTKITSTAHTFDIVIDSGSAITIETYDSGVSVQSIDSIVNKINEQAVDSHLNFLAYKVDLEGCVEIAIAHVLPNSEDDVKNRTIQISSGSADDGLDILGLSEYDGIEVQGLYGNTYHLNGTIFDSFGILTTFTGESASLNLGTNTITMTASNVFDLGIRKGDTVIITGSSDSGDDGSYRVTGVTESLITLDDTTITFEGSIGDASMVHVLRSSAPISELTFEETVALDGAIMFDVFITEDQDVHYSKRLEIDGSLQSGGFTASIIDISKNFVTFGETAKISVNSSGFATLTGPDLSVGESVFVAADGIYKIFSTDKLSFVIIRVSASATPTIDQEVNLYGFNELDQGVYPVSRGILSTSLGAVLGESSSIGVPSLVDKRRSGTVDDTIIAETFLERYIEGPRNELRSSGVIRGLALSNIQTITGGRTFDLSAGIVHVNGIRFEVPGFLTVQFNSEDNFYIAFDATGCLITGAEVENPDAPGEYISPFVGQEVAHIGYIDTTTNSITDLRFFIDKLDLKVLGDIVVAPIQNAGHFTTIQKAVDYARQFKSLYPDIGRAPTIFIQEGTYEVSNTIVLDFDVEIRGTGPNTVIQRADSFQGENFFLSPTQFSLTPAIFLIGADTASGSPDIVHGVTMKDFTYQSVTNITDVGIVIAITQDLDTSPNAMFRFENINFYGPTNLESAAGNLEAVIVWTQTDNAGSVPASITMGNTVVKGCLFNSIGTETTGMTPMLDATCTFKNVKVTDNIVQNAQPTLFTTYNILFLGGSESRSGIYRTPNSGIDDEFTESVSPSASNPYITLNDLTYTMGFDIIYTQDSSTIVTGGGVLISNGTVYRAQSDEIQITTSDLFGSETLTSDTWYYIYLGPGSSPGDTPVGVISSLAPTSFGRHPSNATYRFLSSVYVKDTSKFLGFIKRGSFVRITDFRNDHGDRFLTPMTAVLPSGSTETISYDSELPETAMSMHLNVRLDCNEPEGDNVYIKVSQVNFTHSSAGLRLARTSPNPAGGDADVEFEFEMTFGGSAKEFNIDVSTSYFDAVERVLLLGYAEGRSTAVTDLWQ